MNPDPFFGCHKNNIKQTDPNFILRQTMLYGSKVHIQTNQRTQRSTVQRNFFVARKCMNLLTIIANTLLLGFSSISWEVPGFFKVVVSGCPNVSNSFVSQCGNSFVSQFGWPCPALRLSVFTCLPSYLVGGVRLSGCLPIHVSQSGSLVGGVRLSAVSVFPFLPSFVPQFGWWCRHLFPSPAADQRKFKSLYFRVADFQTPKQWDVKALGCHTAKSSHSHRSKEIPQQRILTAKRSDSYEISRCEAMDENFAPVLSLKGPRWSQSHSWFSWCSTVTHDN